MKKLSNGQIKSICYADYCPQCVEESRFQGIKPNCRDCWVAKEIEKDVEQEELEAEKKRGDC